MEIAMLTPISIVGLVTFLIELVISVLAWRTAGKTGLDWLKLFSAGVLILGLAHFLCKFVGHGIVGLPESYAIGVPFKAIGLTIVIYSIALAVAKEKAKKLLGIAAIIGAYFWITSWYSLAILHNEKSFFFVSGHILFLLLLPWYMAFIMYRVYRDSTDPSALAFSLGFLVYGLATLINITLVSLGSALFTAMSIALMVRALGLAIMLAGFLVTLREE